MLVLSRRKDEIIVIDGQIEIEVLRVKGNTVRLGIRAPRDVKVLRGELSPFGMAEATIEMKIEPTIAEKLSKATPIAHAS